MYNNRQMKKAMRNMMYHQNRINTGVPNATPWVPQPGIFQQMMYGMFQNSMQQMMTGAFGPVGGRGAVQEPVSGVQPIPIKPSGLPLPSPQRLGSKTTPYG